MNVSSGVFTWTAATAVNGTFDQTCGFQPQVIIVQAIGVANTTDGGAALSTRRSFGVITRDGSTLTRWCVNSISRHGNTNMNTGRLKRTDAIVATADPDDTTGEMALESLLDIDVVANWPSDGFRCIVDDQGAVDNRIMWIAWGGDVTNVASGEATVTSGNQDITSPGFPPDLVILGTIMGTADGNEGPLAHSSMNVGMIAGGASTTQFTKWGTSEDTLGTSITRRYSRDDECLTMDDLTTQTLNGRAVGSMLSNGFRVAWTETTGTRRFFWTAIRGGQYSIQPYLPTTTVDSTQTLTMGFEPKGLMGFGHHDNGEDAADTPGNTDAWGVGVGTGPSSRTSLYAQDSNGSTTGTIAVRIDHSHFLIISNNSGSAVTSSYDIDAILPDGVRLIVDAPAGITIFYAVLGIGDAPRRPGATIVAHAVHRAASY